MFAFLSPQMRDAADPLLNQKSAATWLRLLPANDVIGRQQHVLRALEAMRKANRPFDVNRVAALEFVDAALGADRRQLVRQYIENAEVSAKLAERIWQALFEMSQAFTLAYQSALDAALPNAASARWKPVLPLLFVRLVHYHGTDAKLRVFKYERWIPAKWMELHQLYLRACEMQCNRVPVALSAAGPTAQTWTAEQEYLYALLVHLLNSGNLSPSELDWASSQLRAWSRRLSLDPIPRSPEGSFVDLAGKGGLSRRTGADQGAMVRYLDTTPLAESIQRAIQALRDAEPTDKGPVVVVNQQRLAVLRKIQPSLSPSLHSDLRRDPRQTIVTSARVRIGLQRICQDLSAKDLDSIADLPVVAEQIEVFAVAGALRARRRIVTDDDTLAASLSAWSDPLWEVKDRSLAGLRIAATGGLGQSLSLGAIVAVRPSDGDNWLLGVVRRLNKLSNDEVEAGVGIIAGRVVAVMLTGRRRCSEDMAGYEVDEEGVGEGGEEARSGDRFEGLYLPPPSRPDKPLCMKTLIVPTAEYQEGRNVLLATSNSVYTVSMQHLVEQRPDWSWTTFQIIEKAARPSL